MAAGSWFDWTTGDLVTEAKFQDIQDSILFIYASDSAANTALTNKVEGTVYFNTTDDILKVWDGSAWIEVGGGLDAFEVSYLVIGGGGAGGASALTNNGAGGGGAGGYRNNYASETSGDSSSTEDNMFLEKSVNYTVTIGAGGSGAYSTGEFSRNGNDTLFSNIISLGGGQGGGLGSAISGWSRAHPGGAGGGKGEGSFFMGYGTTNQGGDGGTSATNAGGAGGGASGDGGNASSSVGGNGANGLSSSITGSAVTRAGGGGAGGATTNGTGGTGGGGDGTRGTTAGSGTANTGSGGGGVYVGGNVSNDGGNGGSGVVIIRYATADATISVGAGLTSSTTTDGDDTVVTFTAGTDTISFS